MSETAAGEGTIKVIPFTGNKRDWPVWSEKFLARGDVKGYKDILTGKVKVPSDDAYDAMEAGAPKTKAKLLRKLNKDAFIDMLLSITADTETGRIAFQIVKGSKTKDLSDGDARAAWKKLNSKFESTRAPNRLLLKEKFVNSRLKSARSDPDVWITQLEDLQVQINNAREGSISEEDLMEHILGNMPSVYDIEVHTLRKRLDDLQDPLTLEELREELCLKFEMMNRRGKLGMAQGQHGEEHALFAGGFKGKCNNCGKIGHKSRDCRDKNGKDKDQGHQNGTDGEKNIQCFYCKKKGHRISNCHKLKQKEQANIGIDSSNDAARGNDERSTISEVGLGIWDYHYSELGMLKMDSANKHIFIADSGASCHLTGSLEGMVDCLKICEYVTVGNGKAVEATMIGTKKGRIKMPDGTYRPIALYGCKYVPELAPFNLFSITKALSGGCSLGNVGETITLTKGDFTLSFDYKIRTKTGYVAGVEIMSTEGDELAAPALGPDGAIDVNVFHSLLGHVSEYKARAVAKYYGIKLVGKFHTCSACAEAKARQSNVPKVVAEESKCKTAGEKLHMDISSIKSRSFGGAKYWLLVIDEVTAYSFSFFLKRKSDTPDTVIKLIKHLKSKGKIVKTIRCDNAGENHCTEEMCKAQGLGIEFEYSAPNTPQQNGRVERRFATLYGRVRSMLNAANLTGSLRHGLWAECAQTATYLDNLDCDNATGEPRYKLFYGKDDKRFGHIKAFGEMAIVKFGDAIKNKLENRGVPAIYLGHAPNHSAEVCRFLKVSTKRVIRSRDARFLGMTFLKWARETGYDVAQGEDLIADDENELSDEDAADVEDQFDEKVGRMTGVDFDDDFIDQQRIFDDVNDLPEAEYINVREIQQEEPQGHETGRVTRSGRVFNRLDEPQVNALNPRVQAEMRRLDTWYNPAPEANLQEERPNDPLGREEEANLAQENGLSAMDHLLGDFAFYMRENSLGEVVTKKAIRVDEFDTNLNAMHPLDALDYLESDKNNHMSMQQRDDHVRRVVLSLKAKIPKTYKEAWDHPDPKMRTRWRKAFEKELSSMDKRNVWKVIKKKDMPKGRRCVKSKWVFDVKRNGTFKVRLVACGYTQIPGVDFTDSFAPVITDVSWRILIVLMLEWDLEATIVDVETAFLLGDLDEEIYMTCREVHKDDEVLLLQHSIYGLVQAARQYYKKFISVLKKLGFEGGYPDPCLMMRRTNDGVVFIAVWVDDSLLVGNQKAIDRTIQDLRREGFTLKVEGNLQDYLSCEITIDRDKKMGWIHQPHLLDKLEKQFGEEVKNMQRYRTPGTPGQGILRGTNAKVDQEKHKTYRSGVGMLLYLVKHTRPDISNAVRELTKALDAPSPAAYKEMLRVIKYTIDTRDLALKMQPIDEESDGSWTIVVYSDSDFAGDKETRVSIAGFVIYLLGVPICWKSKGMKSVTLSSSEAEYVALAEAAKEVKFVYQVLLSIGMKIKTPIIVRVDNVGAIFMAENVAVSQRTKHIDVKYRFVHEFVMSDFLKIIFVRTDENKADIFTKNVNGDLHDKHCADLVGKKGIK